jgi:preprotein translocase subunit SecF
MSIIKYRKIWFAISAVLLGLSFYTFFAYGFKLSTDFVGGSIIEARYEGKRPEKETLEANIKGLNIGGFSVRPSEDDRYIVRTKDLTVSQMEALLKAIDNPIVERSNTVGPVAGAELKSKAVKAISVVIIMIVLFITFVFRKVSNPVSSWKYGLATIVALIHDVVIPTGFFVFLGATMGIELDLLFVTGLLAILGYSVHDTIVVFDRVRENLRINQEQNRTEDFEHMVGKSVSQTFARSINTSLTIFITLLALYIFGSTATKDFSLLLLVGVVIGTYSSIFVASPLLVTFFKLQKKAK